MNDLTANRFAENPAVFQTRFQRCYRLLHFIACRVLGGPERAADAVENCWLTHLEIRRSSNTIARFAAGCSGSLLMRLYPFSGRRRDEVEMRRIFRMEEPIREDKVIEIIGPDTFSMTVDYDKVDQESVLTHARKMVKLSIPIGKGRPPSEPDPQVGEEIRKGFTPVVLKFPFGPRLEICAAHSSLGRAQSLREMRSVHLLFSQLRLKKKIL